MLLGMVSCVPPLTKSLLIILQLFYKGLVELISGDKYRTDICSSYFRLDSKKSF